MTGAILEVVIVIAWMVVNVIARLVVCMEDTVLVGAGFRSDPAQSLVPAK